MAPITCEVFANLVATDSLASVRPNASSVAVAIARVGQHRGRMDRPAGATGVLPHARRHPPPRTSRLRDGAAASGHALTHGPLGVVTDLFASTVRTAEGVGGAGLPGHRNLQGWSA